MRKKNKKVKSKSHSKVEVRSRKRKKQIQWPRISIQLEMQGSSYLKENTRDPVTRTNKRKKQGNKFFAAAKDLTRQNISCFNLGSLALQVPSGSIPSSSTLLSCKGKTPQISLKREGALHLLVPYVQPPFRVPQRPRVAWQTQ